MSIHFITGANGFIGSRLCMHLLENGLTVRGSIRNESCLTPAGIQRELTGNITGATDWSQALAGVEVVYHLAGLAHCPGVQELSIYKTGITEATVALAQQAAVAGVKRLIFLSTASVYGVDTAADLLVEESIKQPTTPYGQSKLQAEIELEAIAQQTGLEIVIIRPPLVYGRDAPGNFSKLVKLIRRASLLPFGAALEKRSFIGIDNLLDFLLLCATSPTAANKTFNISDDNDISTSELCRFIAAKLKKKCALLPVPSAIMRLGLKAVGKEAEYNKLFGRFGLNISQAKLSLGWKPAYSVTEQLSNAIIQDV